MVLLMTTALTKKMTDSKAMNNFIKLHLAVFVHLSSLIMPFSLSGCNTCFIQIQRTLWTVFIVELGQRSKTVSDLDLWLWDGSLFFCSTISLCLNTGFLCRQKKSSVLCTVNLFSACCPPCASFRIRNWCFLFCNLFFWGHFPNCKYYDGGANNSDIS